MGRNKAVSAVSVDSSVLDGAEQRSRKMEGGRWSMGAGARSLSSAQDDGDRLKLVVVAVNRKTYTCLLQEKTDQVPSPWALTFRVLNSSGIKSIRR
jgi:hypothetical protein